MRKRILQALPLGIAVYLLGAGLAWAVPPIPFSPYGTARINGANVADGTAINAWCGGVQYDTATTQLYAGESWYGLSIRGDDPDTAGIKEGCAAGETVQFKIGSLWAGQTAIWTSGAGPRLDLTALTATATPTPSATLVATFTPTRSPTPTSSTTATRTAPPTSTRTPTPTRTAPPTPSATITAPPTATFTPTRTPASTPTPSRTVPPTPTPSRTATLTPSATTTATATPTATPTPTSTPTPTRTATLTPSATPTATLTASPTLTRTPTPSVTPTATALLTPTADPDDLTLMGVIYDRAAGYTLGLPGARLVALLCVAPTVETHAGPDGHYELVLQAAQVQACPDVSMVVMAAGYQSFSATFSVTALRSQPQRDFGLLPVRTATSPPRLLYLPLIVKSVLGVVTQAARGAPTDENATPGLTASAGWVVNGSNRLKPPVQRRQAAIFSTEASAWVGFAQPTYTVDAGQAFTATLNVQNAENLGGWELLLRFDPAYLALEAVTPGDFLAATGRTAGPLGPLGDPATGQFWLGGYSYGADSGVSGSGALALIRWRALTPGQTALALEQVQLAAVQGPTVTAQPVTSQGSQVNIPVAAALAFTPGWNLIAFPRGPANPAPGAALADAAGGYDLVYAYNACDGADPWKKYDPAAPPVVNDLTAVGPAQGLWLHATRPLTFTVTGAIPTQSQITLCAGWNLIGYPSAAPRPIATALASIAGDYDLVYAYLSADLADPWKKYDPAAPPVVNDLAQMGPGLGYWLRATQATTLTVTW